MDEIDPDEMERVREIVIPLCPNALITQRYEDIDDLVTVVVLEKDTAPDLVTKIQDELSTDYAGQVIVVKNSTQKV